MVVLYILGCVVVVGVVGWLIFSVKVVGLSILGGLVTVSAVAWTFYKVKWNREDKATNRVRQNRTEEIGKAEAGERK